MRIAVTVRFQNSYFSGSVPQVATALSCAFANAGHDVTLVYPAGESDWFIDVPEYAALVPRRVAWGGSQRYDAVIEVAWALKPAERLQVAPHRIGFVHHPPVFYDMESCVYQWNPAVRDFTNLTGLMTYDFWDKTDVRYLEFLSGLCVQTVPYVWDADALDKFVGKEGIREWSVSAKEIERLLPTGAPESLSWCARVVESNFSNTSHAILPLNIVSEIRKRVAPIRFTVHNGEALGKHPFFLNNIAKNLLLPDLSGNMVPRVRLPELRKEKAFFVAHSRFRPFKSYHLDALYLGIPMLHNCEALKTLGAPYYYELNQILQATEAFKAMDADYKSSKGFFSPAANETRRKILRARFAPSVVAEAYNKALSVAIATPATPATPAKTPVTANAVTTLTSAAKDGKLRVAFAHMWDDFQPKYNFFMYLLSWVGAQNGIQVELDEASPNVVFFGPWSNGGERKWPGVPKVYYTGENSPPNKDADTFLNIGFGYETDPNYARLPLWVLEINWWGADVEKIANPKPVSVEAATTVANKGDRKRFCAFVATNPANNNRNAAFHILNQWRGVEAGGRLFCNRPGGPIPAGRGGGGGELMKVDYYKDFKFVITFENSSAPGYTTEKLFHAKVAGAVPIYWGDPFVDRDFDSRGFINANGISTPRDLVELVQRVADDPSQYEAMVNIPAVTEAKRRWCESNMEVLASKIFKRVLEKEVRVKADAWKTATNHGRLYEMGGPLVAAVPTTGPTPVRAPNSSLVPLPSKRVLVSAANAKYVEAAVNLFASMRAIDKDCKRVLYVWPDVNEKLYPVLQQYGVDEIRILPTDQRAATPWADYWDPQHFAWKLWVHNNLMTEEAPDTCVLYIDSGTKIANSVEKVWRIINTDGIFLLDDPTQHNERWCHTDFVRNMNVSAAELAQNQLWAGSIGFKVGGPYKAVIADALRAAATRETIIGNKWHRYSDVCFGHRHDQSILSVLTARANLPRQSLHDFYCDTSMRAAQQFGTPFYVHRGNYKEFEAYAQGIDEAYLINLPRRKDRLTKFKTAHPELKDKTYVLPATDGRTLALTPELAHCFRDNDFKWKKAIMGCALSHLTLWEKLANDKLAKSYLIMEDDVHFRPGWLQAWAQIAPSIPEDADVIYLGGVLPPNAPAFPQIIEPVNQYFARVKKNTLFGGTPRRYFHFCNYAYVLTQSGARKIVKMVKERGIFTSGDHMIVNHGDDLLNIYFTTPLLAKCWQDDDPAYQQSAFNDFSRIDNFDSDLWNNDERFTEAEVRLAASGEPVPSIPIVAAAVASPAAAAAPQKSEEHQTKVWADFLRVIATKETASIEKGIDEIFNIWGAMTHDEVSKKLSWYRILEQLLLTKNAALQPFVPKILALIETKFPKSLHQLWNAVFKAYDTQIKPAAPGIDFITDLQPNYINAWHMAEIKPSFLECQWLDNVFPKPLQYKKFDSLMKLLEVEGTPLVICQKLPSTDVGPIFKAIAEQFAARNKQMIVLHLSDEFANDDIRFYDSPAVKAVVRNYWRPNLPSKAILIPLGYTNGRSGKFLPTPPTFGERKNIFAFSGSLDRPFRIESLDALKGITPNDVHLRTSWSDPEPQNGQQYNASLRNAKFVPCFCGSKALESFRVYEALEHGAIPIYVPAQSTTGTTDEFVSQYGPSPLLGFPSWSAAAEMLPALASKPDVMEKHRQKLMAWWSEVKESTIRRIAGLF